MTTTRLLVFLACASCAEAAPPQNMQQLYQAGNAWLEKQAAQTWPGVAARAETSRVDDRLNLLACRDLQFSLPMGTRLGTKGSFGVECRSPTKWRIYLSYQMRLTGPALVARESLSARSVVGPDALEERLVDYEYPPSSYLVNPRLPAGTYVTRPLAAGQAVLADWLAHPPVISAGQRVRVQVEGGGFSVSQEGQALNNAAVGEVVRVKTLAGRILRGLAQEDGSVGVQP
jgi:flagella basal body P-ring formation protein FlgA